MPVHVVRRTLAAPAERVFSVLHDYERRLAWDRLLHPVMGRIFAWETRKRLDALDIYLRG